MNLTPTLRAEYASDWQNMRIVPARFGAVDAAARRIISYLPRYQVVASLTGAPASVIGLIHMREADFDFRCNLANGDLLTARTHHVPAGRPVKGNPPFTWEEAAADALQYDDFVGIADWPIEVIAWKLEGYNGFGPRNHGRKSGYLWAGSSIYDGGKYVGDGRWSPTTWDQQLGCLPVLRRLIDLGAVSLDAPAFVAAPPDRSPKALQAALNKALGISLLVDGIIGPKTHDAIEAFQKKAGIDVDGIAGPQTWAALDAANAPKTAGDARSASPATTPKPAPAIAAVADPPAGKPASAAAPEALASDA